MASSAGQEPTTDDLAEDKTCDRAARIIELGHPEHKEAWAYHVLRSCGSAGASAVSRGFLAMRTSTDVTALLAISQEMNGWRDGAVFAAAKDVARDQTASVPARVFALRHLLALVDPNRDYSYEDLAAGLDERGWPRANCLGTELSHAEQRNGSPLPTDYRDQAYALGTALSDSQTEPAAVRSAASCLFKLPES